MELRTIFIVFGLWVPLDSSTFVANAQSRTIPPVPPIVDRAKLQTVSGPASYGDDVGGLTSVGCCCRGAKSLYEVLAPTNTSESGASVQVVIFPKGYNYAAHDAFGSLLMTAAYDAKLSRSNDLSIAVSKVRCMPWEFEDKTKGGVICFAETEGTTGQSGSVQWVSGTLESGISSVGIAYRKLEGLPGQVIDKYLREYPSDVPANPTWHLDWETKDLEKWTDVLQQYKDDLLMLQAGAAYLTRYDKRSFGLLDALRNRDDAIAFSTALDGVVVRMNQAIAERKAKTK